MKKNNVFFILSIWWFIILFVIGCLTVLFTPHRERISADENRVLQNIPAFSVKGMFNGKFAAEFENFLSDSVPGRKTIIGLSDSLMECLVMNTSEDRFYLDQTEKEVAEFQEENGGSLDDEDNSVTEQFPSETDRNDDDSTSEGDAVFELIKRSGGTTKVYDFPKANIEKTAKNLEYYTNLISEDGYIYVTFVPFPELARRFSDNLDMFSGWRSNEIEELDKITSDRIRCFNTLEILEQHMLEGEDLFLHGNHQWNIHGAYYVYCKMIEAQGLSASPYQEYEYKVNRPSNPAFHDLDTYELIYPLAPSHNYRVTKINKRDEIPFMGYNMATNSAYLYGPIHPWKTVVTGFHTGRNCLIIGDCFDLSLTPFLLPYYDEVHKTDMRYMLFHRDDLGTSVADMIKRESIDDVYFIFSQANGINSATMLSLIVSNLK